MRGRVIALVAACLLLAGCATPDARAPGGKEAGDDPGTQGAGLDPVDPVELVNLWRVHDAEGEEAATWLRLEAGSYQLWRECGFLEGGWAAAEDALFLASPPFALVGSCLSDDGGWPEVPWLAGTRAVERTGEGWALLGADGQQVARLVVDGAPEPIADAADFYAEPPVVTDATRAAMVEPRRLPEGLAPPTVDQLLGRWVPAAGAPNDPHAVLDEDRTWTASDGCNGTSGAWTVGPDGRFLATSGVSTMIGCEGAPVGSWLGGAQRVGLDGQVLVLLDKDGAELGRLARG